MTTYIVWNKAVDEDFRAAYLNLTGEAIPQNPKEDQAETRLMVGSSRFTADHQQVLATHPDFSGLYIGQTPPADWIDHPE